MICPNTHCKLILDVLFASLLAYHCHVYYSLPGCVHSTLTFTFTVFSLHYLLIGGGATLVLCGIVCLCRP